MTKILVRIALAAIFLLAHSSCDKPEDNTNSLGPPTDVEAIQKAQIETVQTLDPGKVNVGQTAHVVETQELVTSQGPLKSLISESLTTVIQVEEYPQAILLTIDKDVVDHTQPDKPKFEFTDVHGFEKTKSASQAQPSNLDLSMKLFSSDTPAQKSASVQITDVTFHNLLKQKVILRPPDKVIDSGNCRGMDPCHITADQITYDIVFYMSDGSLAKHQIEWQISPQVPFFSSVLKQCASTVIPVDTVRVLVKQCQQVVDFTF